MMLEGLTTPLLAFTIRSSGKTKQQEHMMDTATVAIIVGAVCMMIGAGVGYYNGREAGYDAGTRDAAKDINAEVATAKKLARNAMAYSMINNTHA